MSFDWKSALKTVAPTLATALGGPLAGVAIKSISDAVLGKPDGSDDEIAAAIQSGGADALLKLKTAEQQFTIDLKKLDIDFEKIHAGDRANARDREIKTGDKITPRVLAALIVVGYFAIQWYLLTHLVDSDMREIIMRTLGTIDMALGLVLGYYFGSSAGSREKDEAISKLRRN